MPIETSRGFDEARIVCISALGPVLTVLPLALWVAWSKALFLAILSAGVLAGILIWVLADQDEGEPAMEGLLAHRERTRALTDEFLKELSNTGPWTHHNRLEGSGTFRRRMNRLKELLKG